jgi:hypothetical protein
LERKLLSLSNRIFSLLYAILFGFEPNAAR